MRTRVTLGLALLLALTATGASAGPIHEVDYAGWDVRLTDSKGVETDLSDFGFWTGPNILVALRGDSKVEIPFRLIRSIQIGRYQPADGYSPATVTTRDGKSYKLEIERFEGQRFLGGRSDFGSLRIQLMQAARLDFKRLSHTHPGSAGA